MKRNQVKEIDKWDLSLLFKGDSDWENALRSAQSAVSALPSLKDTMTSSADELYRTVRTIVEVGEQINRIYTYANLRYSEDTSDNTARRLIGQAQNILNDFSEAASFFDTTLLTLSNDDFERFLSESEGLREYEITLRETFRYKPHRLSLSEEKLLAAFGKERETAENTYQTLTDSDLKFGTVKDENGNDTELTNTNYIAFMCSQEPEVRRSAFKTLYKTFKQFGNTIASLYAGAIEAEKVCAKVRNYGSALEASLFSDHMTVDIYDNIINSIGSSLGELFRYYRLKKKVFGQDELHIFDIYRPMISGTTHKYTYPEAVDEVLSAVSIFGDEYVNILRDGYKKRWVDVYPTENKASGAFSSGCPTSEPYIMLNFLGLDEDVSTLAHESGHSMHSYFTRRNNPIQYADYTIFVAEVPSTVNELILAYYQLEHTDDRERKLSILNNLMELFKGTIYRQAMFAEFEKKTHELSEQGEVLTEEVISREYYRVNEKYFGGEVVLDKEIAYEWMRVPHFYYNFYVYKYAVGLASACYIVDRIRRGDEGALDDYFAFLKLGSTKDPIESLKVAGVDITQPEVFQNAAKTFGHIIDMFEELYDMK